MNLNYVNSIAERKMKFRSTTEVVVNNTNELFNCLSVYVPKRFAQENIIGWNNGVHPTTGEPFLTPDRPAVYVAVVDNYATVMTGDLLAQWQPVFRQDTNGDVIIYLIVFDDEQGSEAWDYGAQLISYAPLSAAFNALFPFSYFKFLFDPNYDGRDLVSIASTGKPAEMRIRLINSSRQGTFARQDVYFTNALTGTPATAGTIDVSVANTNTDTPATAATIAVTITNGGAATASLTAGTYSITPGSIAYNATVPATSVDAGDSTTVTFTAVTDGVDAGWVSSGAVTLTQGTLPADFTAAASGGANGTNAVSGSRTINAGTYTVTPGAISYVSTLLSSVVVAAGGTTTLTFTAAQSGADPAWIGSGAVTVVAALPAGLTTTASGGANGTAGTGSGSIVLPAGTYSYNDGAKVWNVVVPDEVVIEPSGGQLVVPNLRPTLVGLDVNLAEGADITDLFYGVLPPAGLTITSNRIYAGSNAGAGISITVTQGAYNYNDGTKTFAIDIPTDITLAPDDSTSQIPIFASTVGVDVSLGQGLLEDNMLDPRRVPTLPSGIVAQLAGTTQGTAPTVAGEPVPSQYFDLSLALAYLCKNNIDLSWMWSLVGITYDPDDNSARQNDKCWIRYKTRAAQLSAMTDLTAGDPEAAGSLATAETRAHYYWAALYLMQCQNTTVLVHSEDYNTETRIFAPVTYIIADILAAWFAQRNASGTYIGNKLSLLRLSGTRIKPLGYPSWLDSSIRENDQGMHILPTGQSVSALDELDSMNVGYLTTIADNTPQESALSMARGVGDIDKGLPVSMMMIAKYVDYTCAQTAAKMITSTGTLANPILTDEVAYGKIQSIVMTTLSRFATTSGRIFNITLMFPEFAVAKTSRTALTAASAWKAWYKDDLDEVEVSGGITAE